jgi:ubiquinone/menaquinone biosynthesis C-methylase UbiE
MERPVYRDPVYTFLHYINLYERYSKYELGRKILDVGAGGRTPPLGLFYEHGFDVWGIDISQEYLDAANTFFENHNMKANLSVADMRELPFDDETFDFVYEFYSMVHLTKSDHQKTIKEMRRVAKPGALLFLGFALLDTWPIEGEERGKNEFWMFEHGDDETVHSFFYEDEVENFIADFEILYKDKRTMSLQFYYAKSTLEDWMSQYKDNWTNYSKEEWEKMYDERLLKQRYTHVFYILKK